MVFTFNKAFFSDAANPLYQKYHVHPDRVRLAPQKQRGDKTYCPEHVDAVDAFLRKYQLSKNHHLLSDAGPAFKKEGIHIFQDYGFEAWAMYTPAVHQYMSPNDNMAHAVAKRRWRAEHTDFSDDVECTLSLLHELDQIAEKDVRKWFNVNLQLDRDEATEALAAECMGEKVEVDEDDELYYAHCMSEYLEFAGLRETRRDKINIELLKSGLDGVYYDQEEK